jgi:hypothetical protein
MVRIAMRKVRSMAGTQVRGHEMLFQINEEMDLKQDKPLQIH